MSIHDECPARSRPEPGSAAVRELRVPVCTGCGFRIDETGLCDDRCRYDACSLSQRPHLIAVYERTDKFLRDEVVPAPVTHDAPVEPKEGEGRS